jgi:hypothetical protein
MKSFLVFFFLICSSLKAEEGFKNIPVNRGNAYLPTYVMVNPKATATIILLPGGDSGTLIDANGKPTTQNFLSRSRDLFYKANFNVLIVFRASDMNKLEYDYRVSNEHISEIKYILDYARENLKKPIWLVGTSRGTVSGTAASIALKDQKLIAGLVLTSSVTNRVTGAIATQKLSEIKIPVLVVHHKMDGCKICSPSEAKEITNYLTAAPIKKFVMIEGGSNPTGDYCQALHWHGFINYEKETVQIITDWIKKPQI